MPTHVSVVTTELTNMAQREVSRNATSPAQEIPIKYAVGLREIVHTQLEFKLPYSGWLLQFQQKKLPSFKECLFRETSRKFFSIVSCNNDYLINKTN